MFIGAGRVVAAGDDAGLGPVLVEGDGERERPALAGGGHAQATAAVSTRLSVPRWSSGLHRPVLDTLAASWRRWSGSAMPARPWRP